MKRTIKLNIKLPAGVPATKVLTDKVISAAQAVIDLEAGEIAEARRLAKDLNARGVKITAEELLSRMTSKKGRGRPAKTVARSSVSKGTRKRVVLSEAQRKTLISQLKAGAKIGEVARSYGCLHCDGYEY
jgi:hypothetical protein